MGDPFLPGVDVSLEPESKTVKRKLKVYNCTRRNMLSSCCFAVDFLLNGDLLLLDHIQILLNKSTLKSFVNQQLK